MNPSIENTIDRVEQLYASITGKPPPHVNGGSTRIPPETDPARHVEEQLGRLVAAVEQQLAPDARTPTWSPRACAWQDDKAFELAIDVPGVSRERLELRIDGLYLVVRGYRPAPWGEAEPIQAPEAREASLGTFARMFALPERVEPAQINARLENGVLRVRVTRRAPAEPSPIPIQG